MKKDTLIKCAYRILHIGFIVLPILAGLDKFLHFFTTWEKYLSPTFNNFLPVEADLYMKIVGVVEIIAGTVVAFNPKIGGIIVSAWLLGIVVNLSLIPGYYDIALRDIGLSLGALALSLLTGGCEAGEKNAAVGGRF